MVAIGADEKKKLYILAGLAGVLILVVVFVIKPFGRGSSTSTTTATTTTPVETVATPPQTTPPGGDEAEGAAPAAPAAMVSTGGAVPTFGAINARQDPFAPKVIPALPPLPEPSPPPPPVEIPQPEPAMLLPARPLPGIGGSQTSASR
jgi:hypothetical protein